MPEQQEFATVGLPMEVQDAMRNQLPQMMNKLLREELAKGEKAIGDLVYSEIQLAKAEKIIDEMRDIKRERAAMKKAHGELELLQTTVQREKDTIDLTKALMGQESSERYAQQLEMTLAGLVRNAEWRKTFAGSRGVAQKTETEEVV
jgi:hypothetical protein